MKSTIVVLFVLLFSNVSFSQDSTGFEEDGVVVDEDGMVINQPRGEPLLTKENIIKGSEFMVYLAGGQQGSIFLAEAAPFVGINVKKILWFGAGINGTYVTTLSQGGGNSSIYGVHAFGRINIAQTYFIQAEFRRVNGPDVSGFSNRKWVGTSILGFGYLYGGNAWLSIGYAINPDFVEMNPMGNFVYRFGFLF